MTTLASPAPASRFAYQARDQRGQVVSGFVNAASIMEASKALRAEGKYIVDIKPAKAGAGNTAVRPEDTAVVSPDSVGPKTRASRDEVINFALQLSVMVDTGVPLSESLHGLSEQAFSPTFVAVLKSIDQDVTGGKDFSPHSNVFRASFRAILSPW